MKLFWSIVFLLSTSVKADIFVQQKLVLDAFTKKQYFYTNDATFNGIKLEVSEQENRYIQQEQFKERLLVKLNCNQNVAIETQTKKLFGKELSFSLYEGTNSVGATLKMVTETRCVITGKKSDKSYRIDLLPFSESSDVFSQIEEEKISSASRDELNLLDSPEDALNERIKLLLGYKLTQNDLKKRDPFMNLDFSQMPKFDLIVLSSLQMNNDFVCNIIFRALAEHAKRGTSVVLLFSEVLTGKKERALLDWIESQSSNVKSIQYKFVADKKSLSGFIDGKHRVNHAKFLATYSSLIEENNVIIAGGRNMSDRYFFRENIDFSYNKNLTQYNHELANPWIYFHDLDFKMSGKDNVVAVIKEALSFMRIKSMPTDNSEVQFLLSVPFQDNRKLEERFVREILEARVSINILSPYIYLSPAILSALKTASEKNKVRVNIILSDSLFGDVTTTKLKELYDEFASDYLSFLNVFHYVELKKGIMHRKAILIDNEKLILGSVNLSRRSFSHDTESAFFFTDKKLVGEFGQLFSTMLNGSQILLKNKRKIFNKHLSKTALELIDEEIM